MKRATTPGRAKVPLDSETHALMDKYLATRQALTLELLQVSRRAAANFENAGRSGRRRLSAIEDDLQAMHALSDLLGFYSPDWTPPLIPPRKSIERVSARRNWRSPR